jgi:hypothetical protein
MYIGTLHTPWAFRDRGAFNAMQECWDFVYKDTPAAGFQITGMHSVVFVLVCVPIARGYQITQDTRVTNDGRRCAMSLLALQC